MRRRKGIETMKNEKKMVEDITSMEVDFAKWYTDICRKADLIDYSSVKGCMIIRPYGYAIWENIQRILDGKFKELGHENVYMPMFIPESLLNKEKEHVEGFAPEVAWVTHGGSELLPERLCVRPTSETMFCGAPWCVGKRRPVRSSVPANFCGRKDTPCTPRQRKRSPKPNRC